MMTVPAAELAEIEKLARDGKEADDALLLGWYLYRHQQPDKAADLFKSALDRGGGAKAAEGYVLALGASGRGLDAVPVAYEWREATVETKKAYTDVMIALLAADPPRKLPPDMLAQFVPFVNSERSAEGAEALGWFAYNTGQVRTAENWFKASLGWRETEAAAFGLAVVKKRLGDRAGFDSLVRIWRDRSPRIARLASSRAAGPTIDPGLAVRTAWNALSEPRGDTLGDAVPLARDEIEAEDRDDSGAERAAPIRLAARQSPCALGRPRPETMAAELALTFAWCLMDLERPLEALPYFERALTIGSAPVKSHAAYGKSLAYLRKGLTDEAAVSAAAAPQDERRNAELTTGILTQRALAFYKEKRFTETLITLDERAKYIPEQNDLMMLRGWSYFELGRYDEAEQVFRAVLKTGFSTEGNRGIAAIQSRTKQVKD
jgi:tetratricopeptide (TPR) repeat protein